MLKIPIQLEILFKIYKMVIIIFATVTPYQATNMHDLLLLPLFCTYLIYSYSLYAIDQCLMQVWFVIVKVIKTRLKHFCESLTVQEGD